MLCVSYSINRLTGTDGFRVLCHQFFPSSLSRREYCLTSSKTFWLKRNKLREALLLFSSNGCMCMGYPHRDSSHGLRNEVALGAPRLLDHCRSPHAKKRWQIMWQHAPVDCGLHERAQPALRPRADHACAGSPRAGNNAREGATKDHSSELPSEEQGLRLVDRAACSHLSLSSLEPALAGEIRRESVHAEGERELAAVVQAMLHHMPDDPGARQVDWFAVPVVGEGVSHLVGTPARQAIRHELPGAVESLHHLGGGWDGRPKLQRHLVPTRIPLHLRAFVLAQEISEPGGTAADDVQGILADGAQVRCGAPLKLRGFERGKRPFEVILVRFPGGVERREREGVFSHVSYLLVWRAAAPQGWHDATLCWLLETSIHRKRRISRTDVPSSQHNVRTTIRSMSKAASMSPTSPKAIPIVAWASKRAAIKSRLMARPKIKRSASSALAPASRLAPIRSTAMSCWLSSPNRSIRVMSPTF